MPRHAAAARGAQRVPGVITTPVRGRPRPAPEGVPGLAPERPSAAAAHASTERKPIYSIEHATLSDCLAYFEQLKLEGARADIADKVVREIRSRLTFLNNVGLNYLSLDRSADTLSGGEAQRIRLASQIGSGLTGVLYVLDEIGRAHV